MKILYAASEATPFAKSGGLADVAGSLPKALVKDGVDARVIMPLYGDLKFRDKLEYVTNYSVPVGWRSQYCGLFKAEVNGVTYYFLDNEYYFKRRGLYGFYDDGERLCLLLPRSAGDPVLYRLHPRHHQLQRLADRSGAGVPEPVLSSSGQVQPHQDHLHHPQHRLSGQVRH